MRGAHLCAGSAHLAPAFTMQTHAAEVLGARLVDLGWFLSQTTKCIWHRAIHDYAATFVW